MPGSGADAAGIVAGVLHDPLPAPRIAAGHRFRSAMRTPLIDLAPLGSALVAGELILTANQRLARAVEQTWADQRLAAGEIRWARPRVQALDAWIESQYQQLRDAAFEPALVGTLANAAVEQRLWRQVIAADPEPLPGDPTHLAALAHSARQLLERWDLEPEALRDGGHGAERFAGWLPQWRAAMARCGLLTREQGLELLITAHRAGALAGAGRIHLLGFASLPPRHRRVLANLGRDLIHCAATGAPGSVHRAAAADADAELAAAAHWAAAQLDRHPERRVAIVIPDLAARRDRVERTLRDLLAPSHCLPASPWSPPPCNLSAGQPLAGLPLPHSALALLALSLAPAALGEVCALLHDPHWGDAEVELEIRARAEHLLRERQQVLIGAADLRQALLRAAAETGSPTLPARRFQDAADLLRRAPRRAGFGAWAQWLHDYLQRLDWPGRRTLDSHEFQQLQHWRELLEAFAALAVTGEEPSWAEAVAELHRLAAATPFQPRTPEARLQVLGVLEAAGLRFDALWVCGMSDARWPEPLDPHPLLPAGLQRRLGMPRARVDDELALALARVADFQGAAPEVIFGHPLRDGEVELQAFAPLRALPVADIATTLPTQPLIDVLGAAPAHEWVAWGDAPPCRAEELAGGGSARLRDQSGCPFNAFAIWRLGARPLVEPEPGLSRALRGELVHRALELFWAPLPDQAALLDLGEAGREQGLRSAVDRALDELARRRPELHGPRLRAVETACLLRLLEAWLAIELARPPFALVAREQRFTLDLDGLEVRLRVDRIDRLADGRLLLLDYKTGAARADGWSGERPAEPQLPLYALAAPGDLAGLALARVRVDEKLGAGLAGIADVELPGCKPLAAFDLPEHWPDALAHWRRVLGALAREFREGIATIGHQHRASAEVDFLGPLNRLQEIELIQCITAET